MTQETIMIPDDTDSPAGQDGASGSSSTHKVHTNSYRPGSRSSMYPELFQQMVCAVLESESYTSRMPSSTSSLPSSCCLPARYLSRASASTQERHLVSSRPSRSLPLRSAGLEASNRATRHADLSPPSDGPKVEVARGEEQGRRKLALDSDKENSVLTLQVFSASSNWIKRPDYLALHIPPQAALAESSIPANGATASGTQSKSQPTARSSLDRFVMTDRDMKGGIAESLSLLTSKNSKSSPRTWASPRSAPHVRRSLLRFQRPVTVDVVQESD